jgi:hypothetical protein
MAKMDDLNQYALYRGDEFITLGTVKEISEFMGLKQSTIRVLRTEKYLRNIKNYDKCYRLIQIERE